MRTVEVKSTNEKVLAELEVIQRFLGVWLIMIGSLAVGRVIVRSELEEAVSYVTFQMSALNGNQAGNIDSVEKVQGYHRGCCGKGMAKLITSNREKLAKYYAITLPDRVDDEELREHWENYIERSGYKIVRAI